MRKSARFAQAYWVLVVKFMMTLQGDKDEDVVVVMASTIPPGYEITTTPETTATAYEENTLNDYRSVLSSL